jgi:hypothetical protein
MTIRPVLLSLLVAATAIATIVPTAAAEDPVPAVCAPSSSPTALSDGVAVLGNDPSTATIADDCYFSFTLPGGVDANAGREVSLSVTGAEAHQVFVTRGAALPIAAPYACAGAANVAATCKVHWPLTQPSYNIRVARTAAGAGDFTVTATVTAAPASGCPNGYAITPLAEGVASSFLLGGTAGSRCYFKLSPNGAADLSKWVATGMPSALGSYMVLKEGDVPLSTAIASTDSSDSVCAPLTGTTRTCTPDIAVPGTTWYAVVVRATAATASTIGVTATGVSSCSLGRGYHAIAAGDIVSSATVGPDAGSKCDFVLAPSQAESLARFTLTPGAANTDLYVFKQSGVQPQPIPRTGFVCSSASTSLTTNDVCAAGKDGVAGILATVFRPTAGAAASGFSLKAEAAEGCSLAGVPASGVSELADNVAVPVALSNDFDAFCAFHFSPNPLEATVRVSNAITNAPPPSTTAVQTISETLYVKRGSPASATSYDCAGVASLSVGTTASGGAVTVANALCDLQNLGDDIHVLVRRASGAPATSLFARAFSPCSFDDASPGGATHLLSDGLAVTGSLLDDAGGACQLRFDVPASADGASIGLVPDPAADYDLLVKLGSAPTPSSFDCRSSSNVTGAAESCLAVLGSGSYYVQVRRALGSGPWAVTASAVSSCSNGVAPAVLAKGVSGTGSLLDAAGAKCYFAFTPGNPLADPADPADDIVKLALAGDAASNFDLYVRKGAVPSTATRDCQSVLAAGSVDACELVVSDGSTYYGMVRRTSGSGPFSILATTSSSCGLGAGYHDLPNGLEVKSKTRNLAGAKCYFTLPSAAKDDLLSIAQTVDPTTALTSFTLTLARDHPASVPPADCTGSSYYLPISGLVLQQTAQCDQLLEDGLPHAWYASVARTSGSDPAGAAFGIKGSAITIPALQSGVPQVGHVDTGTTQYWKVVLPEGASFLDVQTAGDVSNLGCSLGGQVNSLVSTACLLLPFPKLVGCAVAAGYGVDCAMTEATLQQQCVAQTGDAAKCAQAEAARQQVCSALEARAPGSCAGTAGGLTPACGLVNEQTGATQCDPNNTSVKTTEMDLVVRHRLGLPSTAVNDCRSAGPGAVERCLFSADVKEVHDNVTEPARDDVNGQLGNLSSTVGGNRTAIDQAIADLRAALAENRSAAVEPLWAVVRQAIFDATGTDPGGLPATPSTAVPGTPGVVVPDQIDAKPLPGAGKYFIAVRGPLDLASSLYYKGGDYAIVALHDGLEVPSREELLEQGDAALASIRRSLQEQCQSTLHQEAVCGNIDTVAAAICEAVAATGHSCNAPELSADAVGEAVCAVVQGTGHACSVPSAPLAALCGPLAPVCAIVDGVLMVVGELVAQVADALGGPPAVPDLPELPAGASGQQAVDTWILGGLGPLPF